jgi:hypothetical protein
MRVPMLVVDVLSKADEEFLNKLLPLLEKMSLPEAILEVTGAGNIIRSTAAQSRALLAWLLARATITEKEIEIIKKFNPSGNPGYIYHDTLTPLVIERKLGDRDGEWVVDVQWVEEEDYEKVQRRWHWARARVHRLKVEG